MKIEWDKIVTNAISTLITMTFVGAAVIVWKGATTVDTKVQAATDSLKQTIDYVQLAVKLTQEELNKIQSNQVAMTVKLDKLVSRQEESTNVLLFVDVPPLRPEPISENVEVPRVPEIDVRQSPINIQKMLPTIRYPSKD